MKHYYFAFYGNDLLLERQDDGTYSIPYREEPPTATDGKMAMLDVAYADGTTAKTYRLDSPETGDGRLELCGLRKSYYKLTYELYVKAGKCEELLYWDSHNRYSDLVFIAEYAGLKWRSTRT